MTNLTSPKNRSRATAAVATAALPAVVVSSFALAQPAQAATPQVQPPAKRLPQGLEAAIAGRSAASLLPAAQIATALPSALQIALQAVPDDYRIVSGDTMSDIAQRYGLSLDALLRLNNIRMDQIIHPGQTIRLKEAPTTIAPASMDIQTSPAPQGGPVHVVKAGDTLGAIAMRHGVSLSSVLSWNGLQMTSVIHPGQQLKVSAPAAAPAAAAPQAALVPDSFLGFKYPKAVVDSANRNKTILNAAPVPSRAQMKQIVADTARRMGVEPALAMAFAYQESGFNQRAVSPANAIGTMQVIPSSGEWASQLVGRQLNLLDPYDNATAGIAIIRALVSTSKDTDNAIAGYYQGQSSVKKHGMYKDTKDYVAAINAHRATFR